MRADKIGFPSAELWPALFGRPAPAGDILELLTAFLHGFVPALIGPATAEEYPHERYYRAARTGFEVMTAAVVEVESKPARKRKAR